MNNEPTIFFIYSHSESNCGNNHLNFISHPILMNGIPLFFGYSGMIEVTLDA